MNHVVRNASEHGRREVAQAPGPYHYEIYARAVGVLDNLLRRVTSPGNHLDVRHSEAANALFRVVRDFGCGQIENVLFMEFDALDSLQLLQITEGVHHTRMASYVQKFKLHAPFQGGDVQGYELDVLMVAASVTLVVAGAGTFSLDGLLNS